MTRQEVQRDTPEEIAEREIIAPSIEYGTINRKKPGTILGFPKDPGVYFKDMRRRLAELIRDAREGK